LAPGQIADLAPGWGELYRALARGLGKGLLLTFDYGFDRRRLLDRRIRPWGTLACYHRHVLSRNPFVHVGEQDMTAHVDFSTLEQIGRDEGLETVALSRQARWLVACGIFDDLKEAPAATRAEALMLLDPAGMGDEIRVLVQARGVAAELLLDCDVLRSA
jgi:SAM-dependent MidA family methyltransferase